MDLFFGTRAKDYLSMHFEEFLMFIPYSTMVDEFQNIVYKNPKMTPKERKLLWRTLEQEYKPHLDYADNAFMEEGGFWQKQHHIYDLPYYYIDYCIAGINALQYKAWMDKSFLITVLFCIYSTLFCHRFWLMSCYQSLVFFFYEFQISIHTGGGAGQSVPYCFNRTLHREDAFLIKLSYDIKLFGMTQFTEGKGLVYSM